MSEKAVKQAAKNAIASRNPILKSEIFAVALVITAALGFSAKAIFIKLAYAAAPELTPITLLSLRMLFAAPGFLIIAWWSSRGAKKLTQHEWLAVVALGLLGYYAASLLDFIGLQTVSASLERLILFLSPTIVIVISAVFLKRKITRNDLAALAITYVGLAACRTVAIGIKFWLRGARFCPFFTSISSILTQKWVNLNSAVKTHKNNVEAYNTGVFKLF